MSNHINVSFGVPQEVVIGPTLLKILVNDIRNLDTDMGDLLRQ